MSTQGEKAFIVFSGGNDRAVLSFLRALRLCGKRAHIVARTPNDRILRTSYRRDVCWVRESHDLTMDIFVQCVQSVREVTGSGALVVLPSTEYFNAFLLRHRASIEQMNCEIPLVSTAVYERLTSKRAAASFFEAAGFSVPQEIEAGSMDELPVVAKPLHNISATGISLYPQLLWTREQLRKFLEEQATSDYFFQEYVHGDSLYLLMYLPRNGEREVTWSQRNLLQQPAGKSMLLAEPADFHHSPEAGRFIQALRQAGFHGLGMIEMIQTPDRAVFIEMNPRIWGPVQFCLDRHQPLLQAFIGDALHDEPSRYLGHRTRIGRKRYFWLGGLIDTLASGAQPDWHAARRSMSYVIPGSLLNDVFLRLDSWRCFLHDLKQALKAKWHHE